MILIILTSMVITVIQSSNCYDSVTWYSYSDLDDFIYGLVVILVILLMMVTLMVLIMMMYVRI